MPTSVQSRADPTFRSPTLFIEPEAGESVVLDLVAGAKRAVWMEMYLLTDPTAIQTLITRRRAGCDVRVILEPHPYGADGANDGTYDQLAAAGVTVVWSSPQFALTHAKFLTVDHERLAVLTLNLTRAGLSANREYMIVVDDPIDVNDADALIEADLSGSDPPATRGQLIASPGGTRVALETTISGASRTLSVEMEELSDPAFVDALATSARLGVRVEVVLPAPGSSQALVSTARDLVASRAAVGLVAMPTIHAKAIVANRRRVYVGSFNLTAASLDANREVGFLFDDPMIAAQIENTIASDLASGLPP